MDSTAVPETVGIGIGWIAEQQKERYKYLLIPVQRMAEIKFSDNKKITSAVAGDWWSWSASVGIGF